MARECLSPLDASFLEVESPTAHMHVGWAALFAPPAGGRPSFRQLRRHLASRLPRAPRYRQKLAHVPLGLGNPVWVDDEDFDLSRHVRRSPWHTLDELVDSVMSAPLDPERALWEIWIAERLDDGRIGVVGKAHHCMVDGIAAVELATLLLDPSPDPPPQQLDRWRAERRPSAPALLETALRERLGTAWRLALAPATLALSPRRAAGLPGAALRAGRALLGAGAPATPTTALNGPISPERHLARVTHPLDDLKFVGRRFGATVNDVLLATCASALREFLERRGEAPRKLKAMVPVSVRGAGRSGAFGNRISFVFVQLPCDDPDPINRLLDVHEAMRRRKEGGEPEGADDVLQAMALAPRPVQRAVSRLAASPVVFNLTISNIPGPRLAMYMHGCELEAAYPVVPIADRHGVSIGMTTVRDKALFGIYADRESVPDSELLAEGIRRSLDELVERSRWGVAAEPPTPTAPLGAVR